MAQGALSEGLLGQFSLAKEQSDCVEGKGKGTRDEDKNEGEDEEVLEREREEYLNKPMRSEHET